MHTRPLNVVLIVADCLRPDLSLFGHPRNTTPLLDEWFRSARVFSQCRSVSGWTLPACASIVTGQPPEVHGLWDHNGRFRTSKLSHRLDGYSTYGIGNNGNLASDEIDDEYLQQLSIQKGRQWGKFGWDEGFDRYDWIHRTDHLSPFKRGMQYVVDQANGMQPYFLFLHTNLVQDYFSDASYYLSADGNGLDQDEFPAILRSFAGGPDGWKRLLKHLPDAECVRLIHQKYENGVRELDRRLNSIFQVIDFEKTMVVLVSDHGEGFAPDVNRVHHSGRLHDDLLRVPLAIWMPKTSSHAINAGIDDRQCSILDVVPTILDACDRPHSLLPGKTLLEQKPKGHRRINSSDRGYVFWGSPLERDSYKSFDIELAAETIYPLKFISLRRGEGTRHELYHLANDPGERVNLNQIQPAQDPIRLSFVVVVNDWNEFERNIGISPVYKSRDHQWILVDNVNNATGNAIAPLYRNAALRATGDLIIYCHQDVFFPPGWEQQLNSSISELNTIDPSWTILGSVGVKAALAENQYCPQIIGHWCDPGGYHRDGSLPAIVQSLDELWLGVRASSQLHFDDLLPGFHCYGVDICLSASDRGMHCYAIDAFVWHKYRLSDGRMPMQRKDSEKIISRGTDEFIADANRSYQYIANKWKSRLPFFSTSMSWDERSSLKYRGPEDSGDREQSKATTEDPGHTAGPLG